LIERPPTLPELAVAGPVLAETRRLGVPEASLLELSWGEHALAASVPDALALAEPENDLGTLEDGAAGAVVVLQPPPDRAAEIVREACRVGARAVLAVAPLESFAARTAAELAPPGWTGREACGPGDVPLALAAAAANDPALADKLGVRTLDDRERWLALFAEGAFGVGRQRMWVWEPVEPRPVPPAVRIDRTRVALWRPVAEAPKAPRRTFGERVRSRAERELRYAGEALRLRVGRLGLGAGRRS
jgi:hypothetical protein